jgi:hypothetical protein
MMFHVWHVLAIVLIFILGFILGDRFKRKEPLTDWLMNKF